MYLVANQLELSNGTRRDRAECLLDAEQVVSPPAIQKRGSLYIITETDTMADGQPRPGDIDLCREAQEIIVQEYYNSQLTATITSALRQAIEKANQAIFNRNSAALPRDRRGIGLTVALLRNNEIYTAQLPPTQAFLAHQGELRYLPTLEKRPVSTETLPPVQVRTGTDAQATLPMPTPRHQIRPALGRYTLVEPTLNRNVFEDGDLLVMCSSQFSQAFTEDDMEWLLANQDSRNALLNLSEFARSHGLNDGYAFTIGARPDFNSRPTQPTRTDEGGWRGAAEGVAGAVGLFTSKRHPSPKNEAVQSTPNAQPDTTFSPRQYRSGPTEQTTGSRRPTKPPVVPSVEPDQDNPVAPLTPNDDNWLHREDDDLNRPAYLRGRKLSADTPQTTMNQAETDFNNQPTGVFHLDQPPQRDFTYTDASHEPALGATVPPLMPPSLEESPSSPEAETETKKNFFNRPRQPDPAPRVTGARADTPYFDLGGGNYEPPPVSPRPERRPARPKLGSNLKLNLSGKTLTIVGVGVLVVVALLILVMSLAGVSGGGNRNKAADFVKSAEQKRAAAQQSADTSPTQARTLLTQAQADLDAARKEKADLPELTTEQNAIGVTLNNLNRVVVPSDVRLAMDLSSQGAGVRLARSVISPAGDTLYLMDTGRGAIYSSDVTGGVKTLLKSGDKAGGAIFGKPSKMVARPDGLLVLDDGNILWVYSKTSGAWVSQALGGTGGWSSKAVQQAASYQGNLYLLGPGNGQILKYNAGNYGSAPDEWLDPALVPQLGLDTAAGFSIDGTVYTLSKDGKLTQLARPGGKDKGAVLQQYDLKAGDRLGPPLSAPAVLNVGSLDFPYAFVLDAEKRLMQFSKADGSFVQQYQAAADHREFDNLQDVAIDETGKKIYLVGLQKVYVFALSGTTTSGTTTAGNPASPAPVGTPNPGVQPTPGAANTVTIINNSPTTPAR